MPYLGSKLVADIKRGDITELLDDVAAKRQRNLNGGSPDPEARSIQGHLNTVFRWAFEEKHIDAHAMAGISKTRHGKNVPRDRLLSDHEIRAFWSACDQLGRMVRSGSFSS
jgi:integrase